MSEPKDDLDWEYIARKLWDILDDIDTASDMAKGNQDFYASIVETCHKKRFMYGESFDGHTVIFEFEKENK